MATPTSYDEESLAQYMLSELDDVGRALRVSTAPGATGDYGDLTEPVNDVLYDVGTDDLTTIVTRAQIQGLRAVAAVHAWRFASKRAASRYNVQDGTTRLERATLVANIEKRLAAAERIAQALGVTVTAAGVQVRIGRISYPQDPYRARVPAEAAE